MVCGDKETELTNFIPYVSERGIRHQDLEVNMCISSQVRKFEDRSCNFYLNCSQKSYFFRGRTAAHSTGMDEAPAHIGIKVKHNTAEGLTKNKINLPFSFT